MPRQTRFSRLGQPRTMLWCPVVTLGLGNDSMAELQGSRQSAFGVGSSGTKRWESGNGAVPVRPDLGFLTSQDPAAHQLAATIALQRGRLDDAARWASSSLSLRPDDAPTLIMAARVARRAGRPSRSKNMVGPRPPRSPPIGRSPPFWLAICSSSWAMRKRGPFSRTCWIRSPNFVEGWREIGRGAPQGRPPRKRPFLAFARAAGIFGGSYGPRAVGRGPADAQSPA